MGDMKLVWGIWKFQTSRNSDLVEEPSSDLPLSNVFESFCVRNDLLSLH